MDKQNDEELKSIIDPKLFNNSDNNNETIIESETIDNNINETVDNNNKTDCKLRRKSNRISKPIQRSLDTSPNQSLNVKKIGLFFTFFFQYIFFLYFSIHCISNFNFIMSFV
jgi:hypothetical protein